MTAINDAPADRATEALVNLENVAVHIEGLGQDLTDEKAHARSLAAELRHIAQNCDHTTAQDHTYTSDHIHEPTTGGVTHCGPCRAWRVLNGSPDALDDANQEATR